MGKINNYIFLFFSVILLFTFVVLVSASYSWISNVNNITYLAKEDSVFHHNLSANVTGSGDTSFSIVPTPQQPFIWNSTSYSTSSGLPTWIYISNSTTGDLVINATRDNQTGNFTIPILLSSTGTDGVIKSFNFSVSAVNDAPLFYGLVNLTGSSAINGSNTLFNVPLITVTDEENNTPFKLNITFIGCNNSAAPWSTRNSTDCNLFNSSNYQFDNISGKLNISFTPTRNDVGNYTINFTVTDSGNTTLPYNASSTKIISYEVKNVNQAPVFNYACNNEKNWTLGQNVLCWINVSDIDELNNLTLVSSEPIIISSGGRTNFPPYSWFAFNNTGNSTSSIPVNSLTNYNGSFLVNFTATKKIVGNWSINLTLSDTGNPARSSSMNITGFFINNTNSNVSLSNISYISSPVTSNLTFNALAYDDDLLIPDKSVYNENLTFYSNTSWVKVTSVNYLANSNLTNATFTIYPNASLIGNHSISITVFDKNNYSSSSSVFNIFIENNSPPYWINSTPVNIIANEDSLLYLNLSQNVSDPDLVGQGGSGDSLSFNYTCSTCFNSQPLSNSSFNFNSTTGIINFTPDDPNVGEYLYNFTVTDSHGASSTLPFNFTIVNNPENVTINKPISNCSSFFSLNSNNSNVITQEDNNTCLQLNIYDEDMGILQKNLYNDSLNIVQTTSGPNVSLINFILNGLPEVSSQYIANFTPGHLDIGNYSFSLNVTNLNGSSDSLNFNLSVLAKLHPPVMDNLSDKSTSIFDSFYYDVNSTDVEDGNDSSGNFTYTLTPLNLGTFLAINSTNGVIQNNSNMVAGMWNYSVMVTDSSGMNDTKNFTLRVYDYPKINYPLINTSFNLSENNSYVFNFSANHTLGDNLNYSIYVNNTLINSTMGYGNGTNVSLSYTPSFSDETTCSGPKNLTLVVSNSKLSNSTNWSLNIAHTNYPLTFVSNVGEGNPLTVSVTNKRTLNLADYFFDLDATDSCVNQTINFSANKISGNDIAVNINNWVNASVPNITFSSGVATSANYSISAIEYDSNGVQISNVTSNQFLVNIDIQTQTVTINVPSGGGGGGGSTQTKLVPVILKILTPGPISSDKKDNLTIPITLFNSGDSALNGINLSSIITLNGTLVSGISSYFDNPFIASIAPATGVNTTLHVLVDTETQGSYEININASVQSPSLIDSAIVYMDVKEGASVEKKILFADQLMVDNPECAEINEILTEAKSLLDSGKINEADVKTDEAINACRKLIQSANSAVDFNSLSKVLQSNQAINYTVILSVLAVIVGIVFYMFKRIRLRRDLMGYDS